VEKKGLSIEIDETRVARVSRDPTARLGFFFFFFFFFERRASEGSLRKATIESLDYTI
jgi:hypothetical protein